MIAPLKTAPLAPFEWMLSARYLRARRKEGFVSVIAGFSFLGIMLTRTELFPPKLYFLSKLPADVEVGETSAVVIMALTLSFLATLYPSWRAARLDPIEVLRHGG